MRRISPKLFFVSATILLGLAFWLALFSGPVDISPSKLFSLFSSDAGQQEKILWQLRLPRVLLATLSGACLACCGAVMQGLFRNPLADPSLIGVSSGASVGASCMIYFGGSMLIGGIALPLIAVGAFVGGLLATWIVYRLATSTAGTSVATMLLAGIAITALAGAVNGLFSFFADNEMLRRISLWQMGNFGNADWAKAGLLALVIVPLCLWLPGYSRPLNAILLGESEARHLGIDVESLKRRLIFFTALGVGVTVAATGVVAFVGLIVPHIVRLLTGPDHRWLIAGSAVLGAVLLLCADTVARMVITPTELPTGIVTALLGVPFFVALLLQQKKAVL